MTETVLRLWIWNPKALIIAYFLPYGLSVWQNGWSALRQGVWNRQGIYLTGLIAVVIGLLAIWPVTLRHDFPPELGRGHALPTGSYELLHSLRERTAPNENATVLSEWVISSAIPAYRSTLKPMLFRGSPHSALGTRVSDFFNARVLTTAHLDFLNQNNIRYLIVGGHFELMSQCDLLPEYFTPLDRNTYGTLYRVALPLEANDLVEANTITDGGEWQGAIQAYNAILAIDPNNSLAHTGLGLILAYSGKPQAAVRELEAAVSAAPTNAQAHALLVRLYLQLGMDDKAAEHISAAGRMIGERTK